MNIKQIFFEKMTFWGKRTKIIVKIWMAEFEDGLFKNREPAKGQKQPSEGPHST